MTLLNVVFPPGSQFPLLAQKRRFACTQGRATLLGERRFSGKLGIVERGQHLIEPVIFVALFIGLGPSS